MQALRYGGGALGFRVLGGGGLCGQGLQRWSLQGPLTPSLEPERLKGAGL